MWEEKCYWCDFKSKTQAEYLAHAAGHLGERRRCSDMAADDDATGTADDALPGTADEWRAAVQKPGG